MGCSQDGEGGGAQNLLLSYHRDAPLPHGAGHDEGKGSRSQVRTAIWPGRADRDVHVRPIRQPHRLGEEPEAPDCPAGEKRRVSRSEMAFSERTCWQTHFQMPKAKGRYQDPRSLLPAARASHNKASKKDLRASFPDAGT